MYTRTGSINMKGPATIRDVAKRAEVAVLTANTAIVCFFNTHLIHYSVFTFTRLNLHKERLGGLIDKGFTSIHQRPNSFLFPNFLCCNGLTSVRPKTSTVE